MTETRRPNIIETIAKGDPELFLQTLDEGFKAAAREASWHSHSMGLEVVDGRAEEDRQPKPVTPKN